MNTIPTDCSKHLSQATSASCSSCTCSCYFWQLTRRGFCMNTNSINIKKYPFFVYKYHSPCITYCWSLHVHVHIACVSCCRQVIYIRSMKLQTQKCTKNKSSHQNKIQIHFYGTALKCPVLNMIYMYTDVLVRCVLATCRQLSF